MRYTGSFRKNGKSKTVFMGIKFHEKLIFSAFFSRELATNLRSWATRSVTITLWHPENVAPPVWFQALVGCLKPTTDPETLSKDQRRALVCEASPRDTMALLKNMNVFIQLILLDTSQNTMGGLRSKELRQRSTSITLPGPETTLEAPHSQDATG